MAGRSRLYGGAEDMQRMRAMLVSARASIGHGCWHVGDLVWRLLLHSIGHVLGQTIRLWEDNDGGLLGFSVLTPPCVREEPTTATLYFDLQVHPQERGRGLEEQILDWIETLPGTPPGLEVRLATDTGVYENDTTQLDALRHRGFVCNEPNALLLLRPLAEPIAEPLLPEGFALRSIAGIHEAEERAGAHRDAFNPSRMTVEAYRRLMQTPGYTRHLDMVALAPDGTFGAFCLGWLDVANRVGEFEPVGTRAAYRRKGLAKALLLEGLRRMKANGAESVVVGPIFSGEDTALQLYRSVGFREIHRAHSYVCESVPRR